MNDTDTLLPETDDYDVLIVIPTVATRTVLIPTLRRLRERLDGLRTRITVVRNPVDLTGAASVDEIRSALSPTPDGCQIDIVDASVAVGFSGAIDRGLAAACSITTDCVVVSNGHPSTSFASCGIPKVTVVLNDDVVPSHGWLRGLVEAFDEEFIHLTGEVQDRDGATIMRPVEDYGRIGMVGPVSNCAAGGQVYVDADTQAEITTLGPDRFAAQWREDHVAKLRSAVFLSGFCTAFRRRCLQDLVSEASDPRPSDPTEFWLPRLYDEQNFPIAGYEDNDIAHRADVLGWRAAIVVSEYLVHTGHETFKAHFPESSFGLRNHANYLRKWLAPREQRLVAIYRVRFDVPFDLDLFRMSLASVSTIVDGIAVLLTDSLGRVTTSDEWSDKVSGDVRELILFSDATAGDRDAMALQAWVQRWSRHRPGHRSPDVQVRSWIGERNERDERNAAIEMAESMGADWILSVDHDEAIEPRATRRHFERMMNHPDPLIRAWDFAWVNHWNDQRTVNVTRPWGDAGTFTGGMRGFRMFRVNRTAPRRIQSGTDNGLHCGNVPLFDSVTIRTSGLRFRHFGYMRPQDRARKLDRYRTLDPNPDPNLIGGTSYDHIVMEENQTMSAFYPVNGIGLHMLLHDVRQTADLGRHLTSLYGLVDRIVLVWTGAWDLDDRASLFEEAVRFGPNALGVGAEKHGNLRATWSLRDDARVDEVTPATGPGRDMILLAALYGAEWIHQPLNDDFATARNAGIDALHGTPGLGWAVFVDPDEFIPAQGFNALRRMAEATDAWGWLVRFRNQTGPGPDDFNVSENVRMTRLDEGRVMRLTGRVHEQFTAATRSLVEAGRKNVVRVCPVEWTNIGLSLPPEQMEAKIERYRRLTELALTENPFDPGAWVTLGLFYANEGATLAHLECLQRAMASATRGEYLPHYEAGRLYMRLARAALEEAEGRMGGHPDRQVVRSMLSFLESAAPPVPRTGLVAIGAREGLSDAEALSRLPYWPGPPDASNG